MRRHWYGRDTELTVRMFAVMFLLSALFLGFLAILWGLGMPPIFLLVIGLVMVGTQYYFSDKMVLVAMGAHVVKPEQAPGLHAMIDRLCAMAELPKPKVAIVNSDVPNAFATGRNPNNAVVAVTTGIMNRLNDRELEAVLGHELSHIKNRDVTVMTLASLLPFLASLIMQSMFWMGMMGGYGRSRDRNGSALILIYLASILVYFLSFILIRVLSRYRELSADRGGAILTGAPSQLASALVKISTGMQRIPQEDLRKVEAMSAFFIFPALRADSLANMFSTHPSLEERLRRLERMQREMEGL